MRKFSSGENMIVDSNILEYCTQPENVEGRPGLVAGGM
jgi:hypothetical protein